MSNDFNHAASLEGAEFPADSTTVVWTVADGSGNQAQCSFDVMIKKPDREEQATGIHSLKKQGISLYPNPTDGIIHYEFSDVSVHRMSVIDLTGKVLMDKTNLESKGTLNVSKLVNGMYIINLHTEKEAIKTKILKQ